MNLVCELLVADDYESLNGSAGTVHNFRGPSACELGGSGGGLEPNRPSSLLQ